MGQRGPLPRPIDVRVREGNPSKRPLNTREPSYARGIPEPPKHISPKARVIWNELVAELGNAAGESSVLRTVDARALWQLSEDEALLLECYRGIWGMDAELRAKAREQKKKIPVSALLSLISDKYGRMAMVSVKDLATRVMLQRREFGLTPASRSRITVSDGAMPGPDSLELKLC